VQRHERVAPEPNGGRNAEVSLSNPRSDVDPEPGVYSAVVRDVSRDVRPWAGDFRVDAGYRYDEGCFYIVTHPTFQ
jgi:hypothetical protein